MRRIFLLLLFVLLAIPVSVAAQNHDLRLAAGVTATLSNAPPGSCGCFWMPGGSGEASLGVLRGLDASVEITGSHRTNIPDTGRDLSVLTLMAGPRLRQFERRRVSLTEHFFLGAARGFDARFGTDDTATSVAFSAGVGVEVRLSPSIWLRPIEASYQQTALPNGADNRQRNLHLGVSAVFQLPTRNWHR